MPIKSEADLPFVSVIVPAFNSARTLPDVLAALQAQDYPRPLFEVLVVDNGSTDQTAAVVQSNGYTPIQIPARPVGAARNHGAKLAKGSILAFLDSDCIPHPDWIQAGVTSIGAEPCITGAPYLQPDSRTWIHDAWFSQRGTGRRNVKLINSGNLFVRHADFTELGGFDETLQSGEDSEFCLRAASLRAVIADDTIRVVHLGDPKTLGEFCRREIWYGIGAFGSAKEKTFDKPLIATIVFATSSLLQLFGLLLLAFSSGSRVGAAALTAGSIGAMFVVVGTVLYRVLQYRNWRQVPGLLLLYYFYYLCRTFSFYYVLTGRRYYHRR